MGNILLGALVILFIVVVSFLSGKLTLFILFKFFPLKTKELFDYDYDYASKLYKNKKFFNLDDLYCGFLVWFGLTLFGLVLFILYLIGEIVF